MINFINKIYKVIKKYGFTESRIKASLAEAYRIGFEEGMKEYYKLVSGKEKK